MPVFIQALICIALQYNWIEYFNRRARGTQNWFIVASLADTSVRHLRDYNVKPTLGRGNTVGIASAALFTK